MPSDNAAVTRPLTLLLAKAVERQLLSSGHPGALEHVILLQTTGLDSGNRKKIALLRQHVEVTVGTAEADVIRLD